MLALARDNRAIVAIAVATTVSMLGQGMIGPVLPLFARGFGVGAATVGAVIGVFGLARLFLNVPAGLFGERFGRTALMSAGLAITALGNGMTAFSGNVPELLLWRAVAGAGSAAFMTGALAYVADISTPGNRARLMSIQQGSLLLGVDIGPPIGGVLADTFGFRWPFLFAAALAAVAAVWTACRLPNRPAAMGDSGGLSGQRGLLPPSAPGSGRPRPTTTGGSVFAVLLNPTFVVVGLFTLMVFFTRTGSRQNLVPLMASDNLGMTVSAIGMLFFAMTSINFLIVIPAGWLADRFGRKAVMAPGIFLAGLGLVGFSMANSVPMMFAAAIVTGIGTGVAGPAPAAYIADLAPPGRAGFAMGLYRTFGDVGFVIGPVLLGWVADRWSLGAGFITNALLILATGTLLALVARETAGRRWRPRAGG